MNRFLNLELALCSYGNDIVYNYFQLIHPEGSSDIIIPFRACLFNWKHKRVTLFNEYENVA